MTTHSGRAGLRAVDDAVDRLIDQLMDQFREARAEHNIAAAKMRAEFKRRDRRVERRITCTDQCNYCPDQSHIRKRSGYVAETIGRGPRGAKQTSDG